MKGLPLRSWYRWNTFWTSKGLFTPSAEPLGMIPYCSCSPACGTLLTVSIYQKLREDLLYCSSRLQESR